MRVTRLFGKTTRDVPAEADTISHQLMLRAGMINQLSAGVYSYLPLALRVLQKVEAIIRDEMNKAGSQEVLMPTLQPLELWETSGRVKAFGKGLFVLKDRKDRDLVLGPTHEEVITTLVARFVQSYRDLPQMLYQIQTKFRDEPRPRGGLLRVREFTMKDLYSFDVDEAGLDKNYDIMLNAYKAIYERCGLPAIMVEADSGAIGGKASHEFMLPTPSGEDEIICCSCGYAANVEKATCVKGVCLNDKPEPLEPVSTPGMKTIEEVASFMRSRPSQTYKTLVYVADNNIILAVIRGDLEVNEIKLKNALKATDMRLATEAEVREAGLWPGFVSPVAVDGFKVVADDSIDSGSNFIAGGNKPDTHFKNVNYPRDFKADIVTDIAAARAGGKCARCGGTLNSQQGIEVGHIFKLGTFLSTKLGANYNDEQGQSHPIVMGCYGIGVGRLLGAAIEQNHDDKGIIWPMPIAPYQIALCPLYRDGTPVGEIAEKLYAEFQASGLEVLLDDRKESPGIKFNDADLIGLPLRVTVSPRTLEKNSVEVKWRNKKDSELIPLDQVTAKMVEWTRSRPK